MGAQHPESCGEPEPHPKAFGWERPLRAQEAWEPGYPHCLPDSSPRDSISPPHFRTTSTRKLKHTVSTLRKGSLRPGEGRDRPSAPSCTAHLPLPWKRKPPGSTRKRSGLPTTPSHSGRAGPHSVSQQTSGRLHITGGTSLPSATYVCSQESRESRKLGLKVTQQLPHPMPPMERPPNRTGAWSWEPVLPESLLVRHLVHQG